MTPKELPAQVASVIHAIASITTCTSGTVDALHRLLLATDDELPVEHYAAPVRRPKASARKVRVGKTTGSRLRKAPQVTVIEEPRIVRDVLSPREKISIATQVVNSTLQSLTAALKDPLLSRPGESKLSTVRTTSISMSMNDSDSEIKRPLQPRCVNRISTSPDENRSLRRSSASSNNHVPGLVAQAECACVAFAALRKLQLRNTSKENMPGLQLENGMSALIGKLIALGFHDLAMRELTLLKNRIDGTNLAAKGNHSHMATEPKIIPDLLKYSEMAATGPSLSLVVALQLHALKLIAAKPSSHTIEAALVSIQPGSPRSLVDLIERQLSVDSPEARAKAAHQLESLTHFLMGLCPKASKADDGQLSKSNRTIGPLTIFRLQSLTFQIRAIWWKVARHKGDVAKEIWEPFSKCLGSFRRNAAPSGIEKYQTCKTAVETLLEHVQLYENKAVSSFSLREQILVEMYQQMAELAQECSVGGDVDKWWTEASELLTMSRASRSRMLSINCRIASARLRAAPNLRDEQELLDQLTLVTQKLDDDVAGNIEDFEDLFVSINSIRRSIILLIGESHSTVPASNSPTWAKVKDQCEHVLVKGVRCLGKCIGTINAQTEKLMRYERTAKLAHDIASPYIESLAALAKRYSSGTDRWYRLDAGLQECISIAMGLECMSSNFHTPSTAIRVKASLYVTISNVYWCRFLHLKQSRASPKELKRVLDLSISPLSNRRAQQESADILPVRLEKQGVLHEAHKDYREAAGSYARALHVLIATGSLSAVAEAAASQPPSRLFSEHGKWHLLSRLLIAYSKVLLGIGDGHEMKFGPVFDDEKLAATERGLLLEQQLGVIDTILAAESISPKICQALQTIASTITSIYSPQAFPIRRLRVVNQLLRIHLAHPTILSPGFYNVLCEGIEVFPDCGSLSFDTGLQQYQNHLVASHRIYIALCGEADNITTICDSLGAWSTLLQNNSDNDPLRQCIDDLPNYLLQLESLTEYLEGHNLVIERLSALKLLTIVYEVANPLQATNVVTKLSELGVQYTRLGNSIEAGLALHKAQKYLTTSVIGSSNIAVSRWHLSYAEYLLSVGNIERW